jgi:nickel-dependent lactate racemase
MDTQISRSTNAGAVTTVSVVGGPQRVFELEVPSERLRRCWAGPSVATIGDRRAAVVEALKNPTGHPPLVRSVVPGDRVGVALGSGVPHLAEIVAGLVETLVAGGVQPEDVTLVRAGAEAVDPRGLLPASQRRSVALVDHDPADRDGLAYLAVLESGQALYLNRALVDADVVVTIGAMAGHGAGRAEDDPLYPALADAEAQARPAVKRSEAGTKRAKPGASAEEVNRLLGSHFAIRAVTGPSGEWLQLAAGEWDQVTRQCRETARSAWTIPAGRPSGLVVAALGTIAAPTWDDVAAALELAAAVAEEQGDLVLVAEKLPRPGPAVRELGRIDEADELVARLKKSRHPDAEAAQRLARVRAAHRLYFWCDLEVEAVEQLGAGAIESAEELQRLVRRAESCAVLGEAARARVDAAGRGR